MVLYGTKNGSSVASLWRTFWSTFIFKSVWHSVAHMAIAHNSFFISSFVFGSLYFSQISACPKSDIDKVSQKRLHLYECIIGTAIASVN